MHTDNTIREYRTDSPFVFENETSYRRWRDWKLEGYPLEATALVVEVGDPRHLEPAEAGR